MTKPIELQMTLSQQINGEDQWERSCFSYTGRCLVQEDRISCSYQESAPNAPAAEQISALLTITRHQITMSKKGAVNTRMIFQPEAATPCQYQTSAGTLSLEIRTREASWNSDSIHLDYEIFGGGELLSRNRLQIAILH